MVVPIPEDCKSDHSNSFVEKPIFFVTAKNPYRQYRDCGDPAAADNLG